MGTPHMGSIRLSLKPDLEEIFLEMWELFRCRGSVEQPTALLIP